MDELKSPDELAGSGSKRHDRISPFVVAGAQAAEVVGTGASRRNEHEVAVRVHRHDRPCVGSAAGPRHGFSRTRSTRKIGWDWIPTPAQRAGSDIKRAHNATGHIDAPVVIDR